MKKEKALVSWSGGKDSCMACYKAIKEGYDVKYLMNFVSAEYGRCAFHGTKADLIKLQAERIGIELIQPVVTSDAKEYEKRFKNALTGVRDHIPVAVFGDIYLDEHKEWVERVCGDVGVKAIEPLWNMPTMNMLEEFLGLGFKAVVVSCQADKFGKDLLGRVIDRSFVKELHSMGICPCGENGEFHTLVVDGPLFKQKINILESEPVLKEGFWKHWFLDIKRYS